VRGGINFAAHLSEDEKKAGLFTASTGNHGQSIAFAARAYGMKATIAMPQESNPHKVSAIRRLGAEIIFYGKDFDEAREYIEEMAREKGGRYVGPTEELLISGVGTYALEIIEDLPEVESIIVPVGGGSGASGTAIVAKTINPKIEVIAAQSAQAPAMQLSWAAGKMITAEMKTFAEGVATRVPFENTQRIMREYLDDFVLVDDEEIEAAILLMMAHTHSLSEGAGAIPLAAALKYRDRFVGKKIVLVLSGGNLSMEQLRRILAHKRAPVR
jgi:threonine dehydratase